MIRTMTVSATSMRCYGCVHDWGCNYDPMATEDDGSCDPSCAPEVVGCGNLSYQGYDYEVVKIGSQCWFAENLRSEQFENGDPISFNTNEGGDGLLYTWYAVDDARGLCPSGWNVPSGADWSQLKNHLGGYNVAGEKMKSTDGWLNGGNGTNTSGFNALPSGYWGRGRIFCRVPSLNFGKATGMMNALIMRTVTRVGLEYINYQLLQATV